MKTKQNITSLKDFLNQLDLAVQRQRAKPQDVKKQERKRAEKLARKLEQESFAEKALFALSLAAAAVGGYALSQHQCAGQANESYRRGHSAGYDIGHEKGYLEGWEEAPKNYVFYDEDHYADSDYYA